MGFIKKLGKKAKSTVSKTLKNVEAVAKKPSIVLEDPKAGLEFMASMGSGGGAAGAAGGVAAGSQARDINKRLEGEEPELEMTSEMPDISDSEISDAARAQRRKYGRAATLLTGGAGLTSLAPTARRTLIGS